MNKRHVLIGLGLTTVGTLAGFGLKTVLAEGIPSPNPLYYSGTLTEGGALVTGTRAITVNLWPDGTTQGTPLCTTVASTANVVSGRFRIALASSCKAIINQNSGAYVELIDGATSLGRSPVGAVPYAVEADHAVSSTNATNATSANTAAYAADAGHASTADNATNAATATNATNATNAITAATANAAGGALATTISTIQAQAHSASAFHAWLTNLVSVPTNTGTPVAFNHVEFDLGSQSGLGSEYDGTTGTFTAKQSGTYLAFCACEYSPSTAGSLYQVTIFKNGARVGLTEIASASGGGVTPEHTTIMQLQAGDTITCGTYQNTGVSQSLYILDPLTQFGATRLY